jgi:hypothetical protein
MKFQIRQFVCGVVAVSSLVGCGGGSSGPPSDPNAFPFVQCTIKAAGKGIEGAVVGLHAKSGSSPKIVGRYDGESGNYRFGTMDGDKEKPGVPEGTYVVTVAPGRGSKVSIPGKYAKAQSSDLTLEVKKGEDSVVPLVLN